jgi:serine/threonine protein kinase
LSPEGFRQIEELYHAARVAGSRGRAALLAQADPELRREVESLLAQSDNSEFLDRPAIQGAPLLLRGATGWSVAIGACLGPYRIESKLGEGGMGEVFRAVDTRLGRAVAIKTTRAQFSARFEREARAISALNHPNICTLYDIGPNYLVMELLEGETVAERLKHGPLPVDQSLRYAGQIAAALAHAHEHGIVHRDLKPGNLMLVKSGLKVLDFGLASRAGDDTITGSRMVIGTPAYMAPEQREGRPADARTDLYSLGCVLYEMLTGARATSDRKPIPSRTIERIVSRCVATDPACRWQAAVELASALEDAECQTATELLTDSKNLRADSESVKAAATEEQRTLIRKLFGSKGPKPYQLWEILHIKMLLRCVLLVYLAWRFKNVTSGTWNVTLFFSTLFCCTIQSIMAAVLLFAGSMDRELLRTQARKFAPWLRMLGLANGVLATSMTVWVAQAHTILAALIALLGIAIGVTALTLKPMMDRLAIDDSNR